MQCGPEGSIALAAALSPIANQINYLQNLCSAAGFGTPFADDLPSAFGRLS